MPSLPRTALRPALAVVLLAGWAACGGGDPRAQESSPGPHDSPGAQADAGAGAPGEERAYAVQLHVQGPFGDGPASIASQSHEAAALGVDVLWWSEPLEGFTGAGALEHVSFEPPPGPSAPEPGAEPRLVQVPGRTHATGDVRHTDERARDGAWSYQVTAACLGPEWREFVAALEAPAPGHRRPLAAEPRIALALWVEGADANGAAWVELLLSEHPLAEERIAAEGAGGGLARLALRYVLGGDQELRTPRRELRPGEEILWIPLEHREREWNLYELEPAADAARGFPERIAQDNALTGLHLGIGTRAGQAVTAFLDDLRIETRVQGPALYARQRELLASAGAAHPGLTQLQGLELGSLGELAADTRLPAPGRVAAGTAGGDAPGGRDPREVVAAIHARGGLAIRNHPLGAAPTGSEPERPRDELLAELLEHGLDGADLLEVGFRDRGGHPLRDHLWAWDRLALEGGLRPVGIGTGDHRGHTGAWREAPNDFVTWIPARAPTAPELIAGLRSGAVWFGDPAEFQGTLRLTTARGQRMGQLVVTDRDTVELELAIDGLAETDRVIVVESGELTRFLDVGGEVFRARETLELPPEGGFVRAEALTRGGRALVFSNPIHFLRSVPEGGLDPARGAVDLGGVRSLDLGGLRVSAARALDDGLALEGRATGGTLLLECDGRPTIELEGFEGRATVAGPRLRVDGLAGTGRLVVRAAR